MSVDNFIPSIWAGNILRALDTALVYASSGVVNRDYEGELAAAGDTVRINQIGDPTVSTYSKNTDIASVETLSDDQLILKVDQQKYFNFQVDHIDVAQQRPKVMDEAARRAAYALRKAIDSYIGGLYTDISALNINTTNTYGGINLGSDASPLTGAWNTAGSMAYDKLMDLSTILDTNDVPDDGQRFCVVPPWFESYLLKDARFVGYGTMIQNARLVTGTVGGNLAGFASPSPQPNNGGGVGATPIGMVGGINVYKSNQVPNTTQTKYKIIAGHPMAWSFAQAVTEVIAYTPEKRFGDALKGLVVYGAKVVRPNALAGLTANAT